MEFNLTPLSKINQLMHDILLTGDIDLTEKIFISDKRMLEVLRQNETFDLTEQQHLIQSLLLREQFLLLASNEKAETFQQWQKADCLHQPDALLAAADDDQIQPLHYQEALYEFYLIPIDELGEQWRIEVLISEELIQMTPCGFKLVDKSGREWLSGQPNEQNELIGFWLSSPLLLVHVQQYGLPFLMPL